MSSSQWNHSQTPLTVTDSIRSVWATLLYINFFCKILQHGFFTIAPSLHVHFSILHLHTCLQRAPFRVNIFLLTTVQRWWRLHFRWSLHALPTQHQSNRNLFVCGRSNMYFIFLFMFIDIMVDKKINSLFRMYVCHTCGSRSLLFYFRISYPD